MSLTREEWDRAEALFARIMEMPAEGRREHLRSACTSDPVVFAEVSAMLTAAESDDDFLSRPVSVTSTETASDSLPDGVILGPWRILEPLGRGGMGEVYRAERCDGTYQQFVAVKLLKRGLDTDSLVNRFLRERRILAQLKHPNIAQLIDAGAATDGRPYLVMEFVDGQPITDWCKQHQAPLPLLLKMMCEVCDAVHAAHRRLVVHRDLKPSNVLVTEGRVPKLLDFGIAKLVGDVQDDETLTQLNQTPVTPQYAAPEQILGQAVTTATDVYALGVLLYQLLTDQLPNNHGNFSSAALAFSQGRQAVIIRPSAVLRERARKDDGDSIYPPQSKEVRGDLDLIVLKCLSDDPERRYGSASDLADDLRRFLDNRPILARPDSLVYVTRQFIRRNRLGVAVATTACALLVAGVAGIAFEWRNAQRQAARAELIKNFVISVFQQQDPMGSGRNSLTPKQLISAAITRADEQLRDDHDLHAELLGNLGEIEYDLGDTEGSLNTLHELLLEQQSVYGASSLQVAETLRKMTLPLRILGRHDEERQDAEQALAVLERQGAGDSLEAARVKLRLAFALAWGNGAPARSLSLHEEADRIFKARLGPQAAETIDALLLHASTEEQGRQDQQAEVLLHEVVAGYEALYGPTTPRLGQALILLGHVEERQDRPDEAEATYLRAIAVIRPALGPRHHDIASVYDMLGSLYANSPSRYADAEKALKDGQAALPDDDSSERLGLLRTLARLHIAMNRFDLAEPESREVFEEIRKGDGERRAYTWYDASMWGRALAGQGKLGEAEAIQRQASKNMAAIIGADAYPNCLLADALADTLEKKGGSASEVLALRRQALNITETKYPRSNSIWAARAIALARALELEGGDTSGSEALPLLDQVLEDYRAKPRPEDGLGEALLLRGRLEARTGKADAARSDLEEALGRFRSQPSPDADGIRQAESSLRDLGVSKASRSGAGQVT